MVHYYKLEDNEIDFSQAVSCHSADATIAYKKVSGEPVYLGYYLPADFDKENKYPLFVFVHGGGWSSHKIFDDQTHWQGDYLGYLARYYAGKSFVCVSVDYRLTREGGQAAGYEVIDCYEDCCDAMDYVLAHRVEYGIDMENIYLLGESAGGHLAGALATFHYDRQYPFKKAFLVNPITHLFDKWNMGVPVKSSHPRLADLSLQECAEFLSPLYQISESTCDTVLIHGQSDGVVDPEHSRSFYDRMTELSKGCELHLIENTGHAFLLAEYTEQLAACKIGIGIINGVLGAARPWEPDCGQTK